LRKILLADGNSLMLAEKKSFLEVRNFDVVTTTSAMEVMELVREHRPNLIILDFEMEGMSGDELCRRLKRSSSAERTPVLIASSREPDEIRQQCLDAGATLVLRKAEGRDALLQRIVQVLGLTPRRHVRVRCDLRISIDESGEAAEGTAQNISESGLFLTMRKILRGGSPLRLAFTLPGTVDPIEILGEVVRIETLVGGIYGYGIQFLEAEPACIQALKNFTERTV
jgi:CheY-like chemotaxis protein